MRIQWAWFSYYAYRLGGAVAPHVPPWLGYRAAEWLGAVLSNRAPSRAYVRDNVAHIVGLPADSAQVRQVAQQVFRNQAKNYFDLLRVASLSPEQILATIREVRGIEHIDNALARGRGVVLVSAHFGNFDLAGQALALRGYRVTALAEHLRPERLFRYVRMQRESHGLTFVPIDASLRPAFRALRANELVGTAIDRNVTDAGRLVRFFGRPARLPDGYVRLALHTGAALVPCFCRRLPDDTFVITVEPEVDLQSGSDMEQRATAGLLRVVALFEDYLRRDPDQWVFFVPAWDHRPARCSGAAVTLGHPDPSNLTRMPTCAQGGRQ